MSETDLLDAALKLPVKERARIAHELILSLEDEPPEDSQVVEKEWAAEIERRIREIETGAVKPIPWQTVHRDVKKALQGVRRRRKTRRTR